MFGTSRHEKSRKNSNMSTTPSAATAAPNFFISQVMPILENP
jgi:hypothetical protein